MSSFLLPAAFESVRVGLSAWYGDNWATLPQPCVPLSYFNPDIQQAVEDAGLNVDDFEACRNPEDGGPMWTQWVYKTFPTCVGFSAKVDDDRCEAREMFCAGAPQNIADLEYGDFGDYEMQVAAVQAALAFEHGVHQLCPIEGVPTVFPATPAPADGLIAGCRDPGANNFNELADGDDGSCTYNRSNTDFGMESRWWMNWRLAAGNVQWIKDHPGAVTTIIPAHNLFKIQMDGTLVVDQWFRADKHITPYKEVPQIHIMPCIDFKWTDDDSAIYSAYIHGNETIKANLLATAYELADLAVKYDFSGYMLDYEPHFDYQIAHTKAFMSFTSMVKNAVDDADRRILPTSVYAHRRVGLCLSNWGIINVLNPDRAAEFVKSNADIMMSMGYTYFLQADGEDGFAEARERVLFMKKTLPTERVTIGISVEVGNSKTPRWWNAGQTLVNEYVSFIRDIGIASVSVWGMWDTYNERVDDPDIELFAVPFDTHFIGPGHWDDTCDVTAGVVISDSVAYQNELQSYKPLNPGMISVHTNPDGSHEYMYECLKTCVAADNDGSCDNSTFHCPGNGAATEEEIYMAIADAIDTPTGFHPNCASTRVTCTPKGISSYWQRVSQYESVQSLYPLQTNLLEIMGNEWYYNCRRTGVGSGGTRSSCDSRYVYCAGTDGLTFGYGSTQMKAVALAVSSEDHLHPLAPRGCDDNIYMATLLLL